MTNSNLPRVTQKIFGENAGQNIGQFGSAITGTPNPTGDISEIQALGSWGEGWAGAVLPTRDFPALEEMTGIQKVITQQLAYFFQKGFPEWDENTTYFASTSFAQVNGVVYQSLTNNNKGNNPTTSTANWKIWDPDVSVNANVDLSNLSGTGENHFANPNLSNITDTAEQHIDTVAARPLSDNACTQEKFPDEYSYWVEQAHSTFDLSKFEVMGSPTISEDGIASGFSAKTNFLYKKINLANRNFVLNFDIIASEVVNPECFMSYETNYTTPSTTLFRFQYSSGQRYLIIGSSINNAFLPMDANKKYKFNLQYNVATKIFTLLQYDYNNILINTWSSSPIDFNENGYLIIGNSINASMGTSCSIDLKSIAVWVDGQPVFTGNQTAIDTINETLEIPYTETTDGTKVVDAAYYDRVQSCREQKGQALYLTLDEQNQAYYLPQGTVSGMISQNKQKIDELDTTLTADILQAMPVGASIAYELATAPDGWFAENGLEVQQSEYPKLYAVIGNKYNLETTQEGYFRLPDTNVSFRYYQGSTAPGILKDAGLPNIKATGTGFGVGLVNQISGAAYNSGVNAERIQGGDQDGKRIDFNASYSNSIYGKSSTVQPKTITKFFIIKHD